ncbi:D-glycero-beta-D-manno-heptose 1,7-bisphosphate 7-phosphatase [Pseudomonas sp. ABC1]|uniref:D-glycero-beta-D-manno-heptose 1,7-bisphosphate 7-phosphatase n=1 Tax=Pseudomonas sp. ABC1 TaxID=2748080 RepID=UPI0015C3072A|nr:D-glycero-beta-D-manno-heptose 1,7-bisphosphate 7-phosphatase [Pseudomonas sp. ABC1]QLF93557.1 D-glycero-beta-D-manno-heptose 1,7-bisphosphate 7-phosphatase [Pseudomonas sp. ABC1]
MKLIVLDRDGVINEDSDAYVKSVDEWIPIPGSLHAIARLYQAGWTVAVATNQSGLARGMFDADALDAMHRKMQSLTAEQGGHIELVVHCPHGPEDHCDCRKPLPGLFRTIAGHFHLADLAGVPVVGDSLRDLQAGVSLGCIPYLVRTGKGEKTLKNPLPTGTQVFPDLSAVADHLLGTP